MRAFEMRSKSDYDDFADYSEKEVKELMYNLDSFLQIVEKIIQN